jgi:hypothetical protein
MSLPKTSTQRAPVADRDCRDYDGEIATDRVAPRVSGRAIDGVRSDGEGMPEGEYTSFYVLIVLSLCINCPDFHLSPGSHCLFRFARLRSFGFNEALKKLSPTVSENLAGPLRQKAGEAGRTGLERWSESKQAFAMSHCFPHLHKRRALKIKALSWARRNHAQGGRTEVECANRCQMELCSHARNR